jgi:hypothetical protein
MLDMVVARRRRAGTLNEVCEVRECAAKARRAVDERADEDSRFRVMRSITLVRRCDMMDSVGGGEEEEEGEEV